MLLIPGFLSEALISTNGCVFWASAVALMISAQTFISTEIIILTKNVEIKYVLNYNLTSIIAWGRIIITIISTGIVILTKNVDLSLCKYLVN